MAHCLNSYRPLVHNAAGRMACQRFGHPPYVDSSCRREPDFESLCPSITSLCRGSHFAPRLHVGDRIIYVTNKTAKETRYIVAALEVIVRFESHGKAAEWYRDRSLPLPSNCLVRGNSPLSLEHTDGGKPKQHDLQRWDAKYWSRARRNGVWFAGSLGRSHFIVLVPSETRILSTSLDACLHYEIPLRSAKYSLSLCCCGYRTEECCTTSTKTRLTKPTSLPGIAE